MSEFIVNLDKAPEEFGDYKAYPQAYHRYKATVLGFENFETKSGDKWLKVQFLVNLGNDDYEEKTNGLGYKYGTEHFSSFVSQYLKTIVRNNEGRIDESILTSKSPDLSKTIGLNIGVEYKPQFNNPKYTSVDSVVDLEKVNGCYDQVAYEQWLEGKKKEDKPKEKVPPGFLRK